MRRRPRIREADERRRRQRTGTWVIRTDEPQESVEDPFGLQRPTDRADEADPEGLGDSLSELPEARVVRTAGRAKEMLRAGEDLPRTRGTTGMTARPGRNRLSRVGLPFGHVPPAGRDRARGDGAPRRSGVGDVRTCAARAPRPARPHPVRAAATAANPCRTAARRPGARHSPSTSKPLLMRAPECPRRTACTWTCAPDAGSSRWPCSSTSAPRPTVGCPAPSGSWTSRRRRCSSSAKRSRHSATAHAIFAFSGEGPEHVSVIAIKGFAECAEDRPAAGRGARRGWLHAGLEPPCATRPPH